MTKNIAVLLTCHNRREKTLACLRSLFNCPITEGHAIDVFLVDDGSTDNTAAAVKQNFQAVNIIPGNGKLFWNRGMHLAWQTAAQQRAFDFYLWLNDDVELFPAAIDDLLKCCPENNSIVVGTMCSRLEETPTYGGRKSNRELIHPNGNPQICDEFNGNLVLIPDAVYKQIGNLDPIFIHSIGDYDYALRAKQKGIRSYITPNYLGYCEKHESLAGWCVPEVPLIHRIKILYTPRANSHPIYFFRFEHRHFGLMIAIKHFLSIHLRAFIPQLWK